MDDATRDSFRREIHDRELEIPLGLSLYSIMKLSWFSQDDWSGPAHLLGAVLLGSVFLSGVAAPPAPLM